MANAKELQEIMQTTQVYARQLTGSKKSQTSHAGAERAIMYFRGVSDFTFSAKPDISFADAMLTIEQDLFTKADIVPKVRAAIRELCDEVRIKLQEKNIVVPPRDESNWTVKASPFTAQRSFGSDGYKRGGD